MKQLLTASALIVTVLLSTTAFAGETRIRPQHDHNHYDWYFGMTVKLKHVFRNGRVVKGLKVTHVRRHGPADRAGLEPGDFITRANGANFAWARGNHHAVRMLQDAVHGGGVPTSDDGGAVTFVRPPQGGDPLGQVTLKVIDIRNPGRTVAVDVHPEFRGHDDGGVITFGRR